jgi:hypothetical protein
MTRRINAVIECSDACPNTDAELIRSVNERVQEVMGNVRVVVPPKPGEVRNGCNEARLIKG